MHLTINPLIFLYFLILVPFQEHFVLFLGNSHKTAMLRSRNALNIHRIREITKILICLADTIVLRMIAILDISHTPGIITNKLEGRATLAVLLSFETYVSRSSTGSPQPWFKILAGSSDRYLSFHPLS